MGITSKKNIKYAKKIAMIMTEAAHKGSNFNISKVDLLQNIKNNSDAENSENFNSQSNISSSESIV